MGSKRGKNKEELARREVETKTAIEAWKPDPLETILRNSATSLLTDFNSGKDVKDMEGLRGQFNLYDNAVNRQNAEKLGGGIFNASASNTGGLAAAITAQNQRRQQQEASGQLNNAANNAFNNAQQVLAPGLMDISESRNANKVNFFAGRESEARQLANRPNPWLGVLQQGLGMAGAAFAGGFGGGGGSGGGYNLTPDTLIAPQNLRSSINGRGMGGGIS